MRIALAILVLSALAAGCFGGRDVPTSPEGGPDVDLELFLTGLANPVYITHAGDDSGRLFILEQAGRIRLWDETLQTVPFLDIRSRVASSGEQGLLGLAFPADYAASGDFYVHYTDVEGDTVLSRFQAIGNVASSASEEILLQADQPFANHNGGWIEFGPDGYLYMALGDGGSFGDPERNAQDKTTILGKILRLDVSGTDAAAAPGNPFIGTAGHDMVWAWGLRNPWRSSFDRETGDLWIGDVGQGDIEEVNRQPADSPGGENYGWPVYEGTHRYGAGSVTGHVKPVAQYDHDGGHCSVIGGYVYRGSDQPALEGVYFFGDFCSGTMWSLEKDGSFWEMSRVLETELMISSFGEDEDGELYVVDRQGGIYRLVAA